MSNDLEVVKNLEQVEKPKEVKKEAKKRGAKPKIDLNNKIDVLTENVNKLTDVMLKLVDQNVKAKENRPTVSIGSKSPYDLTPEYDGVNPPNSEVGLVDDDEGVTTNELLGNVSNISVGRKRKVNQQYYTKDTIHVP